MCYVWSIALYGSETWTLRKLERKYLESWRRMEKIKWPHKVTNGQLLRRIGEKKTLLNIIRNNNSHDNDNSFMYCCL